MKPLPQPCSDPKRYAALVAAAHEELAGNDGAILIWQSSINSVDWEWLIDNGDAIMDAEHDLIVHPHATRLGTDDGYTMQYAGLVKAGFSVWQSGGGCTAWRIELPNDCYLLITDQDGASHELAEGELPVIGVYDEDGETLFVTNPA